MWTSSIRDPPQNCLPALKSAAIQGHSPSLAFSPPTIRSESIIWFPFLAPQEAELMGEKVGAGVVGLEGGKVGADGNDPGNPGNPPGKPGKPPGKPGKPPGTAGVPVTQ